MINIDLLSQYARSIRNARYAQHALDFRGSYATVRVQAGQNGPSKTFYYSPSNFYVLGVSIDGAAYFTNDADPILGATVPFGSSHAELGTYGMTVNRTSLTETLKATARVGGNNLKAVFAVGAVFFAEALRSDPVLQALASMLTSNPETSLSLRALEHYCSNWSVASVKKNAGVDHRVTGFGHRWLGLDEAHYPLR